MKLRRRILRIGLLLGFAYALYLGFLWNIQREMLFPGQHIEAPARPNFEVLELETDEGIVEAIWLRNEAATPEDPAPVVVWAHGNGQIIDWVPPSTEFYQGLGFHVLIPEYRGFGRSAGTPTQARIVSDFDRFIGMVESRPEVDASRLVYHGYSLGGGVVGALALKRPPHVLILQSTFTSVRAFAWGMAAPELLVRDPFDTMATLREFQGPALIIHGRDDEVVPFEHARRLHKAATRATLLALPGRHVMPRGPQYWRAVTRVLTEAKLIPKT